jgi:hypothetical protein
LGEGHAKGSKQGEDGGNEDDTTTAKEVIEGVGNPSGTVRGSANCYVHGGRLKLCKGATYNKAMVIYGIELTKPMIQLLEAQVPSLATGPQEDPAVSGMPRAWWKVKLAPLEPVCGHG